MCWAFRTATTNVNAANSENYAPHIGRINRAGKDAPMLITRKGELQWSAMRYGMMLPVAGKGPQLIWNARNDKLSTIETWTRLIRQRFATPVDAYVENTPNETWHVGPTAWMVGFFDVEQNGGCVAITEDVGEGRAPVLINEATAMEWLAAKQWNALPAMLRGVRTVYTEADLFEAKMLETDARTKVPLDKAA